MNHSVPAFGVYWVFFFFLGPLGLEVGRLTTPFLKCVSSKRSKKTINPNPSPIGNGFGLYWFGAGGGTRTHTLSPAKDFESSSSANSNTPARLFLKSLLKITNRKLEGYAGGMLRRNTVFSFQKFPVYQGLSHPAWETAKSILSPSRLPIPSFRRNYKR